MTTYREADRGDRARCVRFADLDAGTRERLRRACAGEGEALLLADPELSPELVGGVGAVLLALGVGVATAALGHNFGSLEASWPAAATGAVAGLGAGAALIGVWLMAHAWRQRRARPADALPPGAYLLVHALVDARADPMRIRPVAQLKQLRSVHGRLRLTFADGAVVEMNERRRAADLGRELEAAQQRALVALATGDEALASRLDPLGGQRQWPPDAPAPPPRPAPWAVVAAMLAAGLVAGEAAAPRLLRASEDRGFARAAAAGDDRALLGCAERGGRLSEAADAVRLDLARRAEGDEGLVRYLATGGRRRDEALGEVLARLQREPSEQGLRRFLDAGGAAPEAVDAMRLKLALDRGAEGLRAYVGQGGLRGDEVMRSQLPRQLLRDALEAGDAAGLRALMARGDGEIVPAIRQEAAAALSGLYRAERQRLREAHGSSPSPLVRLLDDALERAATSHREPHLQLTVVHAEDPDRARRRRDPSGQQRYGLSPTDSDARDLPRAVAQGVATAVGRLVNPRLVKVDAPGEGAASPPPCAQDPGRWSNPPCLDPIAVSVVFLAGRHDWYEIALKMQVTLPDGAQLDLQPRCRQGAGGVWASVAHALGESVAGKPLGCPDRMR